VPIVHMGGVPGMEPNNTFYDANQRVTPINSPTAAFDVLFGGAPAPSAGPAQPNAPSPLLTQIGERQGILNLLRGEIGQLRSQLRGIELEKLDLHVESIAQLEGRLELQSQALSTPGGGGGGGVVTPVQCNAQSASNASGANRDLDNSATMLSLAVQGFACDLTRVAVVEFGNHQSTAVTIPGASGDWHNGFIHGEGPNGRSLPTLEAWLSDRFVETVRRLQATPAPDGNGTLYDQTLMLWGRNMGDSNDHNDNGNVRFVLAGRAGGYLRHANGGRYLNGNGASHQQVLIAAAEAMGVRDVSRFGRANLSRDPLTALKA
jgi:hypothetical protein